MAIQHRSLLVSLLAILLAPTSVAKCHATHKVPAFTLDELRLGHRLPELSEILRTTGLFSVKTSSQPSLYRSVAMEGLCRCLDDPFWSQAKDQGTLDEVDRVLLADGLTARTTVATATIGKTPLSLSDRDMVGTICSRETIDAMENLRDEVAVVSDAFVKSFDRLNGLGVYDMMDEPPLLESESGFTYQTIASIVSSANHLEHFHHYKKGKSPVPKSDDDEKSMDWHTDAGLFLTFLPAWDCATSGTKADKSFLVLLPGGKQAQAQFEPDTIAVMLGAGAEHWLHSSLNLRATRHSVQMEDDDARTWYGMMHLVPEDAIIERSPTRTFGDMKKNMKVAAKQGRDFSNGEEGGTVAIGCGPASESSSESSGNDAFMAPIRRRMQHVQDASACNNITNFFCWTQCLEIPNYEQAESYIAEGNSLYCLDPGILARSGNQVSKAVEPCLGEVHNSNCQGIWHPTSPAVEGWPVEFNATFTIEEKYCYGGTSMYMDGFHWIHDTTCVIYLFPGWVLESQGRFVAACFGTILFGIMVEVVIFQRRSSIQSFESGTKRLLISSAFYGLQLTMGYLIMLVVMTYSMPLFLCCVVGLVIGHVLFNAKDAILNKPQPVYGDATSNRTSEGGSHGDEDEESSKRCCSHKNLMQRISETNHGVPEGSTPCCQNTL